MKRVAINGIILILSGLLASPAFALVSTFRSRVVDEKGVPVVGAKVVLSCSGEGNAQHETKTNKKGEFTQVIMNFKAKWKLVISMDGFLDYLEKDIQIPPGAEVDHPQISMRAGQSTGGKIEEQNAALRKLNAVFNTATALTKEEKYDEALAAYQEIITQQPYPEAYHNMGVIYMRKQDWANAETSFLKVIELKADSTDAMVALGEIYQRANQIPKAQEILAKAVALKPEDASLHYQLGLAYFNGGNSAEALPAFKKAAEIDPTFSENFYFIGTIAISANNIPEAVANLEKYLALTPKSEQNAATAKQLLVALKPAVPRTGPRR